ncbi:hypothetical protein, partial [Klebsiella pneumoniae]|uniref:hypothetical protein n=1 Tax=Klebsiella pneumoniae TaxID=573 RepID=UPI001B8BCFD7
EELENALQEAIAERNADPILNDDERSYNLAMTVESGSMVNRYQFVAQSDPMVCGTAVTLGMRIEEAFHAVTTEAAPGWREQQTRGVVN